MHVRNAAIFGGNLALSQQRHLESDLMTLLLLMQLAWPSLICATLHRASILCAGTHVRNAATVGGNLALARQRHLESDLTTVLMGAGATVRFVDLASCADVGAARCVRTLSQPCTATVEAHSPCSDGSAAG